MNVPSRQPYDVRKYFQEHPEAEKCEKFRGPKKGWVVYPNQNINNQNAQTEETQRVIEKTNAVTYKKISTPTEEEKQLASARAEFETVRHFDFGHYSDQTSSSSRSADPPPKIDSLATINAQKKVDDLMKKRSQKENNGVHDSGPTDYSKYRDIVDY